MRRDALALHAALFEGCIRMPDVALAEYCTMLLQTFSALVDCARPVGIFPGRMSLVQGIGGSR